MASVTSNVHLTREIRASDKWQQTHNVGHVELLMSVAWKFREQDLEGDRQASWIWRDVIGSGSTGSNSGKQYLKKKKKQLKLSFSLHYQLQGDFSNFPGKIVLHK